METDIELFDLVLAESRRNKVGKVSCSRCRDKGLLLPELSEAFLFSPHMRRKASLLPCCMGPTVEPNITQTTRFSFFNLGFNFSLYFLLFMFEI